MLYDEIKTQWLNARRERLTLVSNLLTILKSEIDVIGKNAGREVTDEDCVSTIKKFIKNAGITRDAKIKNHQEPITEIREINFLTELLPTQMSDNELRVTIETIITQHMIAKNLKSMGRIMGYLKSQYDGLYDGKLASQIVRECLL